MGFYLRKSLRVGLIRFNLSKSGIGVSAGVRGLRFGVGPRGNYVHMGRRGLYYRATFPSGRKSAGKNSAPALPPAESTSEEPLREIESGDVSQMCDSSSKELLNEFHRKRRTTRLAPVVGLVAFGAVVALLAADAPSWAPWIALIVTLPGVAAAYVRDQLTKTVVLFYALESDSERDYQELHDAFAALRSSVRTWHVEAEGDVKDWKRSAGATTVIRKKSVSLSKSAPPFVKTNIAVPSIPAGRQTLYFFPDRLLVFESEGVGAVSYADLRVERHATRFIEGGSVPRDARIVGRTWRYVNRNGGPDRRFKNNRELPIALYEDLHFRSESGLNELCQFSKEGVGEAFEAALQRLAKNVPASS